MQARLWLLALTPAALLVTGCPEGELSYGEAKEAVTEAALASEATSLVEGSVELSTSFTLGQAAEATATEVRDFIASQMPCAEVTREGTTVTVEYGAHEGACLWRGRTFSGTHIINFVKTEGSIEVTHEWQDISNGRVEVDGTATVTWDLDDKSRHVVHELSWTRLRDGKTATGSGDRMQSPLDGAWVNGIQTDGSREWNGDRGTWDLQIDGVGWRWIDPVPETGSYVLTTPKDKRIAMSFSRIDDNTIEVTVEGTKRDHKFRVSSLGDVQGDGEEGGES
ncbi:MAG: hypothetical protein HOV80_13060 [Polyangiaceae bacterium]|nr:hypothetical protein [Polyangiaceae bacterium]